MKVDNRYDVCTNTEIMKIIYSLRHAKTISNVIRAYRGVGIDTRYESETKYVLSNLYRNFNKPIR